MEIRGLNGKRAVVVGASRGLGAAVAHRLAAQGAAVVLVARSAGRAAEVARAIAATGARAIAIGGDAARYADMQRVMAECGAQLGRPDILVNNAAVIEPIGRFVDTDPAAWAGNVGVTLLGAYHAARAFLGDGDAAGRVVVNVSSGAAHKPFEGWSAYCTAKAGLHMLTLALAAELGAQGLRVYGYAPGLVDTGMQETIRASGINPISRKRRDELAPPEVPARIIAYLCSEDAADLAGQELDYRNASLRRRAGVPPLA